VVGFSWNLALRQNQSVAFYACLGIIWNDRFAQHQARRLDRKHQGRPRVFSRRGEGCDWLGSLHSATWRSGEKHPDAKPLRGFGGAGILETVEDNAGDTYRAVYTVRLAGRIYVLHVFQKKSKRGIKTPKAESELIKSRLRRAEEEHARWLEAQEV
jgi:phage-related protein